MARMMDVWDAHTTPMCRARPPIQKNCPLRSSPAERSFLAKLATAPPLPPRNLCPSPIALAPKLCKPLDDLDELLANRPRVDRRGLSAHQCVNKEAAREHRRCEDEELADGLERKWLISPPRVEKVELDREEDGEERLDGEEFIQVIYGNTTEVHRKNGSVAYGGNGGSGELT